MQFKSASKGWTAKPQALLCHDSITIPPMTTKTITEFLDHSSESKTTGTVTPLEKFTEAVSLIISLSASTITDKKKQSESPTQLNHPKNQEKHTNCRILRSHSGAIQIHQPGGHGNSQHDSGR